MSGVNEQTSSEQAGPLYARDCTCGRADRHDARDGQDMGKKTQHLLADCPLLMSRLLHQPQLITIQSDRTSARTFQYN